MFWQEWTSSYRGVFTTGRNFSVIPLFTIFKLVSLFLNGSLDSTFKGVSEGEKNTIFSNVFLKNDEPKNELFNDCLVTDGILP